METHSLTTSNVIKWTIADDNFICFIQSHFRAMNTIKFQIYDLLQLYVKQNKMKKKKKNGTVLFPDDLPVNVLTHLCMNGFNFCAITGWKIQKSRELMFLILDPKLRKFEIKRRNDKINRLFCMSDNARFILLYFYLYK